MNMENKSRDDNPFLAKGWRAEPAVGSRWAYDKWRRRDIVVLPSSFTFCCHETGSSSPVSVCFDGRSV